MASKNTASNKPQRAALPDAGEVRRRKRTRRVLIIVGSIVTVLVLIAAGFIGYYAKTANDALDKIQRQTDLLPNSTTSRPPETTTGAMNILILGSDSRNSEDQGRSDVIMLAHVPKDRKHVYLISFPRDMWVDIPGYGKGKINAAYAYGGSSLTISTIEQLTGVRIDHVAKTDFEGFVKVIDEIGGVDVYNSQASKSGAFEFAKGNIHLNGEQALVYTRERHELTNGDLDRAKRQRDVVIAVVKKIATPQVLADPSKFSNVINELAPYFTVDDQFTNQQMIDLALSMRISSTADIGSLQAPLSGFGTSSDGQSIDVVDDTLMAELAKSLKNDTMDTYYEAHKNDAPVPK